MDTLIGAKYHPMDIVNESFRWENTSGKDAIIGLVTNYQACNLNVTY